MAENEGLALLVHDPELVSLLAKLSSEAAPLAAFDASGVAVGLGIALKAGTGVTLTKSGPFIIVASSGGGTGAAVADAFVTVGHPADLTGERALAVDSEHTLTDGGANNNATIGGVDASTTQKGHAKFDTTVPASIGTAAAGTSGVIADRAHVHPTGAGTPTDVAYGGNAATGAGPAAAMSDHGHAGPPLVKTVTVLAPLATDDISLGAFVAGYTVTKVRAVVKGSSTPSVSWNLVYSTDRSAAGTKVWTTDKTTTSTTTGDTFTTSDSAALTADAWLRFKASAVSGTVDEISVTVELKTT